MPTDEDKKIDLEENIEVAPFPKIDREKMTPGEVAIVESNLVLGEILLKINMQQELVLKQMQTILDEHKNINVNFTRFHRLIENSRRSEDTPPTPTPTNPDPGTRPPAPRNPNPRNPG